MTPSHVCLVGLFILEVTTVFYHGEGLGKKKQHETTTFSDLKDRDTNTRFTVSPETGFLQIL